CSGTECYPDFLFANTICDPMFDCADLQWDGGDCEPSVECASDEIQSCDGTECYPAGWITDGFCDEPLNCEGTEWDGGDCEPQIECADDEILGCNGVCADESWIGDSYCDYAFNCPDNDFDQGDCLDQDQAVILINEFDPDQDGVDTREFVELISAAGMEIYLDQGWRIDVINGANGELKGSWSFSGGVIQPDGIALIGSAAVIGNADPGVETLEAPDGFIENDHEAMGIFRYDGPTDAWVLVDAVHWGLAVDGQGEGAPAPADDATLEVSIGRCPDATDTDDNSADFHLMTPSPGAANLCDTVVVP
ncbi:MAG: hypothetical protein QF464_12945, partial [Myxococcota bacterium]|nr:hypothetical protein [Myxococcota bacterium]